MSLIPCRECGKQISSDAKTCPNCGAAPKPEPASAMSEFKKPLKANDIIGGLVISAIAIWWFSSSDSKATSPAPVDQHTSQPAIATQPAFKISANELFQQYEANEVATDNQFKGRPVEVTGKIQSIDKDYMDDAVINLVTKNQFLPARMSMLKSEKQRAANLTKGTNIVIECKKMSRLVGSPAGSECHFVK